MAEVFASTKVRVLIGFGVFLTILGIFIALFGWARKDNNEFQPPNEFKLDAWVNLPLGLDFNKAVLYLLIAGILTVFTMVYVARRMTERPNRIQTAIEVLFTTMRDTITRGSMDDKMAAKWFPFIGAIFLFILYSNLIGFIPLPTNTEHTVEILVQ